MILRILFLLLMMGGVANADLQRTVENITSTDTLVNINVPSTGTVYTKAYSVRKTEAAESIAYMYKPTSSGTIGVSIQAERSFAAPSTEAVADATYVAWNSPATTSSAIWQMATLDTVVMPYVRFKITGTGSNHNSTTVQIKLEVH